MLSWLQVSLQKELQATGIFWVLLMEFGGGGWCFLSRMQLCWKGLRGQDEYWKRGVGEVPSHTQRGAKEELF